MASYNELNALIDAYINRNGVQAITGQILNGVLKAMVEQLGRGYTIMGAAIPATDPGTPDGAECYFASETGTYTDFDGLQIVPGELALLCYTPSDGWTKVTIYEGFQTVQATIDGNVGTPSVGVSYANGVLSFDFHNMKGNPGQNGQDGQDGDPAGFGTIGADITGGVGTPGVTVESSGPDTAKNLAFHFTNLKGETGVTSVVATVDNTSGTPACTVSLVGQQLTLAFSGLKGAQGDTGSSVDYPFTIVNNLTTDDATQALSAAQGVVLQWEITQLEHELNEKADQAEVSRLQQKATELDGNSNNIIADINGGQKVLYTFDADVHQVNTSSTVETSSGTRLRLVYKVNKGDAIAIIATVGKGAAAAVYDSLDNAVYAGNTGKLQEISATYASSINVSITANGYLCVSLCKSDSTSINATQKAQLLAGTTITLTKQKQSGVLDWIGRTIKATEVSSDPDYSSYSVVSDRRISDSGNWASQGLALLLPIDGISRLRIVPNVAQSGVYKYAFLKTIGSYVTGTSADFCSGETIHKVARTKETILTSFPSDCKYIYVSIVHLTDEGTAVDKVELNFQSEFEELSDKVSKNATDIKEVNGGTLTSTEIIANTSGDYDVNTACRITDSGLWTGTGTAFFLPVTPDLHRIIIYPRGTYAYKYAFLKSKTFASGTSPDYCTGETVHKISGKATTQITDIPADCQYIYFSLIQLPAEGTVIDKISINNVSDAMNMLSEEMENPGKNTVAYFGERINLLGYKVNNYGGAVIIDALVIDGSTYYGQGADVYGDLAFRLHNQGICEVFNIADYNAITKISQFELGSKGTANHANCCAFGKELSETGFPYLYVAGGYYGRCYVEKVSENGAELVQTITISDIEGNITIGNDGKLWLFYGENLGTTMHFYKFNLPDVEEGDVTLSLSDAIDSWVDTDCANFLAYYYQGGKIYNGKIYILFGTSGIENKRYLVVWDTDTHQRTTVVPLTATITKEPEDCAIREGKMLIFTNGGSGVNVVNFL